MKTNFDDADIYSEQISERKNRNIRLIENARTTLATARIDLNVFAKDFTGLPKYLFDQELAKKQSVVSLLQNRISILEQELDLIRAPFSNDIDYRKKLLETFVKEIKKLGIRNKKLRFHGTSLISALETIASGEISPSSDRGLGQTSFDINGQISVTDYRSVEISLKDYTGIKDKFLPMGCIFVITPKNRADERAIRSYTMGSLKIFERGKPSPRIKCILTSPESLPIVRAQLKRSGYPETLAIDYFEFLNRKSG